MLSIEESAGYQRIFEKGMEKGLEKGMEKGMEKGQQESLLDVTIRLLSKKFRKIPREYLARIKEQDVYVLQQIIDNIFDINDLKELEDYLQ
jgi:flagellar biosynthesis/type III secretory pathway protein FliH